MPPSGIFAYAPIERVIYGMPFVDAVREEVERLGAGRVFVMASGTLARETDAVARLEAALGRRFVGLFDRMRPHVRRDDVLVAVGAAREGAIDLIVTLGGGTVTDGAKMVALCLANDVTEPDRLDALRTVTRPDGSRHQPALVPPAVRIVAVPTTLSGGEFNVTAGCTDPASGVKHSFRHPLLAPRTVILDPELTLHTPEWLWLSTGIRAVDHAVEDLCSINAHPYVDGTAMQALRLLGPGLRQCRDNPHDLEARLACQTGAWLSMVGVVAGVSKGASHAIGHMLGGTAGVPHGYTSCVMLPSVLRYNSVVNAERQRLVAEALGRPGEDAAAVVAELVATLGLPGCLREVGVAREQLDTIAKNAMHDRWIPTNPRPIRTPAEIREILDMAW